MLATCKLLTLPGTLMSYFDMFPQTAKSKVHGTVWTFLPDTLVNRLYVGIQTALGKQFGAVGTFLPDAQVNFYLQQLLEMLRMIYMIWIRMTIKPEAGWAESSFGWLKQQSFFFKRRGQSWAPRLGRWRGTWVPTTGMLLSGGSLDWASSWTDSSSTYYSSPYSSIYLLKHIFCGPGELLQIIAHRWYLSSFRIITLKS